MREHELERSSHEGSSRVTRTVLTARVRDPEIRTGNQRSDGEGAMVEFDFDGIFPIRCTGRAERPIAAHGEGSAERLR
jgi:hypothetical protein